MPYNTCLKRVTLLMGYKKVPKTYICAMIRKKRVIVVLKNAIVGLKFGKDIKKWMSNPLNEMALAQFQMTMPYS